MPVEVILERDITVYLLKKGRAHKKVVREAQARVHEALADYAGERAALTKVPEHEVAWRAEEKSCRIFARVIRRSGH